MRFFHKHEKKLILETRECSGDLTERFRWYICTGCTKKLETAEAYGALFCSDPCKEEWTKEWIHHPRKAENKIFLDNERRSRI